MRAIPFFLIAVLAVPPHADARPSRRAAAPRPVPAPAPRPAAVKPVRNVILFVTSGYTEEEWRGLRRGNAGQPLSLDRLPWVGFGHTDTASTTPEGISAALTRGARNGEADRAAPNGLPGAARASGRAVALVSAGRLTDPLPSGLLLSRVPATEAEALSQLAGSADILLTGAPPEDPAFVTDVERLMAATSAPFRGGASSQSLPFDVLVSRALRLASADPDGFVALVESHRDAVEPGALDIALGAAMDVAKRLPQTLLVVADIREGWPVTLHGMGPGAEKLAGAIALSDVPKLVAGVMNLKPFPRDFSAFYTARVQALKSGAAATTGAAVPRRPAALPW